MRSFLTVLLLCLAFSAMITAQTIKSAQAQSLSPGCSALPFSNTSIGSTATGPVNAAYIAGEMITVSMTVTVAGGSIANTARLRAADFSQMPPAITEVPTSVVTPGSSDTFTLSFVIPNSGTFNLNVGFVNLAAGGGDSVTYTMSCAAASASSASGDSGTVLAGTQQTVLRRSVDQTTRLVGERLKQLRSVRAPQQRPTAPPGGGSLLSFTGRADNLALGSVGVAAGDPDSPFGAWASLGWTGFDDDARAAPASGSVFTGLAGADFAPNEMTIVGAALGFDVSHADTTPGNSVNQSHAILNAYASFALTDVFSATVFGGTMLGRGTIDTGEDTAAAVSGRFSSQRYFLGAAGNADLYFGDFSLLSSLTVQWSQAFTSSFQDSAGVNQPGSTTELGTVSIQANPGYLFRIDPERSVFFEPFGVFGYSIDYAFTRIQDNAAGDAHPNDRDAFTVGLGFNVFAGDAISANVEATTELGREDFSSTSVFASGRIKF